MSLEAERAADWSMARELESGNARWIRRERELRLAARGSRLAELDRIMARHELESDEFHTAEQKAMEIYRREHR